MKRAASLVLVLGACGTELAVPPSVETATALREPWAEHLIILEELGPPVLRAIELSSGTSEIVFEVPSYGFAYELDVDASADELVLAYTPPPSGEDLAFDRSGIYTVTATGGVRRLDCTDRAGVWCSYPTIAGDAVWFVRAGEELDAGVGFALARVDRSTGQTRTVVPWATEPAISPRGDHLAWVAVDPNDGSRSLELGDAEGAHSRTLVPASQVTNVGQPFFSADGLYLFYVRIGPPEISLIDRAFELLVPSAHAHDDHDVPGDWWRVAVSGQEAPERVTHLETVHYDGRADPGGEWIFVATREGVRKVHVATGEATLVMANRAVRALGWR